jgi:hypothetical protein
MDLNMVRAGVVRHPCEWGFSGYNEIQNPRERYALIDYEGLRKLLDFRKMPDLVDAYRGWVEEALNADAVLRDGKWTETIAVGSESFVTMTKEKLGIRAKGREVVGEDGTYVLQEPPGSYSAIFGQENTVLRAQNEHFWEDTL